MKSTIRKITRIVLIEDHPVFRKGLMQILNNEDDFEVCGEAEDAISAMKVVETVRPDFILVDITLKDSNGIELIKDIKQKFANILALTISMHDETIFAERALKAGAKGYVMKDEAPEIIVKAIRHILGGNIYVSNTVATKIFSKIAEGYTQSSVYDILSDRELEVLRMIGRGLSTREISSKLMISVKTVENHRAHIKEKLDLKNSIELTQQAALMVQNDNI